MGPDLRSLLTEYGCPNAENCRDIVISDCTISCAQLRDRLLVLGNILHEDIDNQIYVARIKSGFGNMNGALIAMQLKGKKLSAAGYAKEGAIKQKICEQAFRRLEDAVHGKAATDVRKSKKWVLLILALISIITVSVIVNGITNARDQAAFDAEVREIIEATQEYNAMVEVFNGRVSEYNKAVDMTCIDNIKGLPTEIESLQIESDSYESAVEVLSGSNSKEKIEADIATIQGMIAQVDQAIAQVKQITAPTGEWVINKLAAVEGITGTQAVTEEMDPDGLLGKEGGFSACIYFAFAKIDASKVPGNSIVEKGTDAGGAVEVYASLADAEARCEYLAGFDGTVLYSGSYAIVGTMVIRTSYQLTNEQQFELTDAITNALTALTDTTE